MAKFMAILGLLRGKISAVVFSHNKGGDYARRLGTPTNPNSTRQQTVRSILSTLSPGFSSLTDEQRAAWGQWASENPRTDPVGNSYTMTGHQAYVSVNCRLVDAALAVLSDPPAKLASTELVEPTTTFTSGTAISVAFVGTCPTGAVIVAWMSAPQSGAGDPNIDQAFLIGYSAADVVTPLVLTLPVAVADGQTVNFYYVFMTDEGLSGTLEKDRVKYTAA